MAFDSNQSAPPITSGDVDPLEYARIVVPTGGLPPQAITEATAARQPADAEDPPVRREPQDPRVTRRHPFEIYVVGQGAADFWPTITMAWGQITEAHTATAVSTVGNTTDEWIIAPAQKIYLEVEIDDGEIVSATLRYVSDPDEETWTDYPTQFQDVGINTNKWFHPIAEVVEFSAFRSGDIAIYTDGGGTTYGIRQLTNTHLRVTQECGTDIAKTLHWKLVPGPGGFTT